MHVNGQTRLSYEASLWPFKHAFLTEFQAPVSQRICSPVKPYLGY